ncbi:MAG: tetratricopeptide repeat protein [Candidatus Zixiibacteriota bacterium]|nr:MAG: tetratricopeptide repeat protein [candidate division Zixibacteria bacterium]
MKTKSQKNQFVFHAILIAIVLLFAAANVGGIEQFWGFNFLKFFGPIPLILALIAVAIVALPPVSTTILRVVNGLSYSDPGNERRLLVVGVTVSVLIMLAGLYFPSKAHLLGDSNLRLNQIHQGRLFLSTEILDFLLHSVAYQGIFQPLDFKVFHAYWVISAICGLFFGIGVFRLARYLAADQLWIAFLLMLSSGVLVLFFGYVESYSVIAALLPHIYLVGLKVADGKARKLSYIIICAAGALAHSVALIIFLPGIILMLISFASNRQARGRQMSVVLTGVILLVIVSGYLLRHFEIIGPDAYLMPLLPRPEYQQGIFTVNHWLNIFNWVFLVSLPVFLLAPRMIKLGCSRYCSDRRSLYALWILIPSCFFAFFFTPQLGGPGDWDLFAIPVFLFIPALMTLYLAHAGKPFPPHSVAIVLVSLITTVSFAIVNNRVEFSINRYSEVIEVARFKNLTKQYLLLANTAEAYPEIRQRRLEFLQRAWDQPPYAHGDSVEVLSSLGLAYLERDDRERAYDYITRALRLDDRDIESYQALFRYQRKYGTAEDLRNTARQIELRFAGNADALWAAAIAYRETGDPEGAGRCLKRAYELDPDSYHLLLFYGRYLLEVGEYLSAINIFDGAIKVEPQSFQAHYLTAVAHLNLGEVEKARRFIDRARNLQRSDLEARQLISLEKRLQQ